MILNLFFSGVGFGFWKLSLLAKLLPHKSITDPLQGPLPARSKLADPREQSMTQVLAGPDGPNGVQLCPPRAAGCVGDRFARAMV